MQRPRSGDQIILIRGPEDTRGSSWLWLVVIIIVLAVGGFVFTQLPLPKNPDVIKSTIGKERREQRIVGLINFLQALADRLPTHNRELQIRQNELEQAEPSVEPREELDRVKTQYETAKDLARRIKTAIDAARVALREERTGTVREEPPIAEWYKFAAEAQRQLPPQISDGLEAPKLESPPPASVGEELKAWPTGPRM